MEKFEIDGENNSHETFNSFINKTKDAFATLVDNIKENIKEYQTRIEDTTKDIADNEASRDKCEHEIEKMEGRIVSIKETIENVENTYKKIVDAYSSTSKGETKDLYSEIIDGAKSNCEKDVEKNKSEIARLNSDIEAIKNNIVEFTKIIDDLNKDLADYKLELAKFERVLEYYNRTNEKMGLDLDNIAAIKETTTARRRTESKPVKKEESKEEKTEKVKEEEIVIEEPVKEEPIVEETPEIEMENVFDLEEPKEEIKIEEKVTPKKEEKTEEPVNFDDSLKQIYDLTGYKPKEEKVETKKEEKPVYSDNLENLFNEVTPDVKPEVKEDVETTGAFDENAMLEWEKILNGADDMFMNFEPNEPKETRKEVTPKKEEKVEVKSIKEELANTVDQLLKPYGTTFDSLKKLTSNKITYKDGTTKPFEITVDDVIKAINAIDGTDLKKMKTVGPEITLLRKIKAVKEGTK